MNIQKCFFEEHLYGIIPWSLHIVYVSIPQKTRQLFVCASPRRFPVRNRHQMVAEWFFGREWREWTWKIRKKRKNLFRFPSLKICPQINVAADVWIRCEISNRLSSLRMPLCRHDCACRCLAFSVKINCACVIGTKLRAKMISTTFACGLK